MVVLDHSGILCRIFTLYKLSIYLLTNQYLCLRFNFAFDYRNDDGNYDFDNGDDTQNVHYRPLISLLATLLGTRIFYHNPTRALLEVKKPYSF